MELAEDNRRFDYYSLLYWIVFRTLPLHRTRNWLATYLLEHFWSAWRKVDLRIRSLTQSGLVYRALDSESRAVSIIEKMRGILKSKSWVFHDDWILREHFCSIQGHSIDKALRWCLSLYSEVTRRAKELIMHVRSQIEHFDIRANYGTSRRRWIQRLVA